MKAALQSTEVATKTSLTYTEKVREVSKYLENYVLDIRHKLHQIPELGWEETKTLALIMKEISEAIALSLLDYQFEIKQAHGGIWVDMIIDPELPTLLFRSDIDALPIEEETGLEFASKHPGKMHACGHDCHAAMLLGAFQAVTKGLIRPQANIRFVWQRAEEYNECQSGGKTLVQEGVCEGVDYVYGLHISSVEDPGVFFSRSGVAMANAALLSFSIECVGGHVMRPQQGSNAIYIMSDIHNALRGFEAIFFPPDEPIAFVPSIATSGVAHNIRPNKATMCFALRNFLPETERDRFVEAICNRIEAIVDTYPTAKVSDVNFESGYPSLKNQGISYRYIQNVLRDAKFPTERSKLLFAGEDFSYYLNEKPGSFWILGARQGKGYDHHTSRFNPDESYLKDGIAFWLLLAQQVPGS